MPELAGEFKFEMKRVWRSNGHIAATHVTVHSVYGDKAAPVPGKKADATDGHAHSHSHSHSHEHSHSHSHDHGHDHHHAHVPHDSDTSEPQGPLRNLPKIRALLENSAEEYIPLWVRRLAVLTFTLLAQAEARVHGAASIDTVFFHEVGAVDSIADTVGSLLALHALGVTSFSCSPLPLGLGTVRTAHGLLPVPAPATLYLTEGLSVSAGPPGVTGELVTPTAAALIRALLQECGTGRRKTSGSNGGSSNTSYINPCRPPRFTLRHVGVGAGTKNFVDHPNILRLMIGDSVVEENQK